MILHPNEIQDILNDRAVLIDARQPNELEGFNCPKALHWDLNRIMQGRYPAIKKDVPLYIFAKTSERSSLAVSLLLEAGHKKVTNIGDWHSLPPELNH